MIMNRLKIIKIHNYLYPCNGKYNTDRAGHSPINDCHQSTLINETDTNEKGPEGTQSPPRVLPQDLRRSGMINFL